MEIVFPYRKEYSSTRGLIWRPVVDVHLKRSDGEWLLYFFYLDSGADLTLIPYRLGRFLGFKESGMPRTEIQGINGKVAVIMTDVLMRIAGKEFMSPVAWSQIEGVPLLLGREGIFDQFEIVFRQEGHKVLFRT